MKYFLITIFILKSYRNENYNLLLFPYISRIYFLHKNKIIQDNNRSQLYSFEAVHQTFYAYIQDVLDTIRKDMKIGVKIQGERVNMIRFADDIAIVAESGQDLNAKKNGKCHDY